MSELKATTIYDAYWKANSTGEGTGILVYLKSEADKVIADLELEVARARLILRLNKPEALYSNLEIISRLNHKIDVVERREQHQKYKRCLAMAKWCHSMWILLRDENETKRSVFYWRWWNIWYELAEKFKEGV